jgi:hypothetical protein
MVQIASGHSGTVLRATSTPLKLRAMNVPTAHFWPNAVSWVVTPLLIVPRDVVTPPDTKKSSTVSLVALDTLGS